MVEKVKEEVREAWWREAERRRSPQLDCLRKAVWPKGTIGGQYLPGVKIGLDRAYWWTKVYKETDGLPYVERRAKAFKAVLGNIPIFIIDHSRLLGYAGARPNELEASIEVSYLANEDLYYDTSGLLPEEEKWWLKECIDYWADKCFQAQCERYLSEEEQAGIKIGPCMSGVSLDAANSAVFDYSFVFENGLNEIIRMINEKLEEAETLLCTGPATPDTMPLHDKIDEWRAMKLAAGAVIDWSSRYSRLAKIVAENLETDPKRKAELLEMSEICSKVPANPVEHLHEGLQCERIVGLAARFFDRVHVGWTNRIDNLYWPYYKKDVLEEKALTRQEAVELFVENNLRIYEVTIPASRGLRAAFQGAPIHLPTLTLGGVDESGKDACNELTEVILEACRLIRVGEPSYMFRYHPGASIFALRACYETIRQGMGYPSFQHDGISQDTLMHNYGVTLEEARSYANVVCMSPGVVKGRGGQGVRYACSFVGGVQCFALALYDGFDPIISGLQIGPHTGDVTKFDTFEEFVEAWRKQIRYAYELATRNRNKGRYLEAKYLQAPFGSCLFRRCVGRGIDMVDARSEPLSNAWITLVGWNDTVDCMYGLRRLIFDEKRYTMEQLIEALKANWVGYVGMRQDFLNLPRFGNDVDEVDELAAMCYKVVSEECGRNMEWGGGRFMTLLENVSGWSAAASFVGALPNGRRLGDCLYDGGISPGAGLDRKGPTAVLRSVSKIDARRFKQILLNQRLSPTQLAGEKGFQLWMNYMKSWCDL